jgi:mono/diheme cytochrome c family protein
MIGKRAVTLALITWLGPVAVYAQQPAGDLAAGRNLSTIEKCGECHVVAPDQPTPPKGSNPADSFAAIADRGTSTPEALAQFMHAEKFHRKFTAGLKEAEIADVVAYITSLAQGP